VSVHCSACSARWFFAALLFALSQGLSAAPTDVLDNCAENAAARVGVEKLTKLCPQVEQSIVLFGLDPLLFDGWRDRLNVHVLGDLSKLVQRYSEPQRHAAPGIDSLRPILKTLQPKTMPKTWWQSVRQWFRNWLKESDSGLAKWLNRWLDQFDLSEHSLDGAIYALMAVLVIAAVIVVVREIRLSGFARRAREMGAAANESSLPLEAPAPGGRGLLGVRAVLQSLIDRLQATGRLPAAASLTHRELVSRSRFDNEQQRKTFAMLAATAESMLYGQANSAAIDSQDLAGRGRELLTQLSVRDQAP
jgi:hypothetical protein